ncbi:unnamed protein product [Haemonchus placei]|uniref:Uncharacterized protein n=1 Tax=Haemonchus placei TaxID=6290 RepID=A0A0N4XBL7_HAEPC|nr:unnamed protein product [Haemonchus placei]
MSVACLSSSGLRSYSHTNLYTIHSRLQKTIAC